MEEERPSPVIIRSDLAHLADDIVRAKAWAKQRGSMYSDGERSGMFAYPNYQPEEIVPADGGEPERKDRFVACYNFNETSLAEIPIFFFGGLYHDDLNSLSSPLTHLFNLWNPVDAGMPADFTAEEKAALFSPSVLGFIPKYTNRAERIDEAYDWNANKQFPKSGGEGKKAARDLEEFADKLFKNRFLKNNTLIPPDKFKGFNFITYSIGGRMAFIVENLLREKLQDYMRTHAEHTPKWNQAQTRNKEIQEYFSKCRVISIGHAVDWESPLPPGTPVIPKTFVIGKDDTGVCYRESFWNYMQSKEMEKGELYRHYDVSEEFNAPAHSHHLILFNEGVLNAAKGQHGTDDLHGLGGYVRAINAGVKDEIIDKFLLPQMFSSLNEACKTKSTHTSEQRAAKPRWSAALQIPRAPIRRLPAGGSIHQPDLPFGAGLEADGNGSKSPPSRG